MTIATPARSADAQSFTSTGSERLREDLELLTTVWRRGVSDRLREARGRGELAGKPELFGVLDEQLAHARTVDRASVDRRAALGMRVRFDDLEHDVTLEYDLVKAIKGDPARGKLSVASPLGRALLGRRAGDVVVLDDARRGAIRYQLREVSSAPEAPRDRMLTAQTGTMAA
jgi:transcription elongation factor GreA